MAPGSNAISQSYSLWGGRDRAWDSENTSARSWYSRGRSRDSAGRDGLGSPEGRAERRQVARQ